MTDALTQCAMDAVHDLGQFNGTDRLAAALGAVRQLGDTAERLESLLCEAREVIRKTGGGDALLNEIDAAIPA